MARLALFHLSDLHFGLDLALGPLPKRQGLSGHDHEVAIELDGAIRRLLACDYAVDDALVLVSGDLSVFGTRAEMHIAYSYLHDELRVNALGDVMGFGDLKDERLLDLLVIPGNHDHWNGDVRNAVKATPVNTGLYNDIFLSDGHTDDVWWWGRTYEIGSDCQLQVMGLESNWNGRGYTRLATGDINPDVLDPAGPLASWVSAQNTRAHEQGRKVARVLTMHHSPARDVWDHRLHQDAISDLQRFCNASQVHAVLTGHIHDVLLGNVHAQPQDTPNTQFLELRCGTSMQRRIHSKAQRQTFLVHELESIDGGVSWSTRHFVHDDEIGQFVEVVHQPPFVVKTS